jgi:hypothetical protein
VADLVTHLASVLLPAAVVGARRIGPVIVGVGAPDVLARALPMALEAAVHAGVPIPEALILPWGVLHEPIPLALVAVLAAEGMVPADQRAFLRGFALGALAHLGLDVLQDHHGLGYTLLAPFSSARFELGWIGSEATVRWAPGLAAVTALAWIGRWQLDRISAANRARSPAPTRRLPGSGSDDGLPR